MGSDVLSSLRVSLLIPLVPKTHFSAFVGKAPGRGRSSITGDQVVHVSREGCVCVCVCVCQYTEFLPVKKRATYHQ